MAKRKVSRKYKKKAMMERAMTQERKAPTPKKIAVFFKNVVHELKRVTWPSRKALLTYTAVVLVTILIFAVLLGLYDFVFLQLVELLARI